MIQLRCASPFQTGTSRTSLWISNHIRAVHLHNVRLYKKSGFSRTGTANYQNVFIPGVFRILWSAWHSKTLCFCENNIIFKFRIRIWSYIFFCSPSGRTILHTQPIFPGIFRAVNNNKFYKNYKVINETGNEFNFDYAWQNGTLNLVKPISFDLKETKGIAKKAYENFGLFTDLKNEAEVNNLRYDLLIGKPESKDLFKEFDHALNLLDTLDKVDIVLEEDIEKYSKKAIKALTLDL